MTLFPGFNLADT